MKFVGGLPSYRPSDSNHREKPGPITGRVVLKHVSGASSAADVCAVDGVSGCTSCVLPEEGRQSRVDGSPGRVSCPALPHVPGPVHARRWTCSANSPRKDFLTLVQQSRQHLTTIDTSPGSPRDTAPHPGVSKASSKAPPAPVLLQCGSKNSSHFSVGTGFPAQTRTQIKEMRHFPSSFLM